MSVRLISSVTKNLCRTIKNSSNATFLGKLTLKQLILLKMVDFPLVPRYNGAPWRAFEAIQKSGLMVGMNIFTIREAENYTFAHHI